MIRKNRYRTSSPPGWGMHWSTKVIKANHTEILLMFITVYIKDVIHLTFLYLCLRKCSYQNPSGSWSSPLCISWSHTVVVNLLHFIPVSSQQQRLMLCICSIPECTTVNISHVIIKRELHGLCNKAVKYLSPLFMTVIRHWKACI